MRYYICPTAGKLSCLSIAMSAALFTMAPRSAVFAQASQASRSTAALTPELQSARDGLSKYSDPVLAVHDGYTLAEIPESPDPERVLRYFRALWLAYQPKSRA